MQLAAIVEAVKKVGLGLSSISESEIAKVYK